MATATGLKAGTGKRKGSTVGTAMGTGMGRNVNGNGQRSIRQRHYKGVTVRKRINEELREGWEHWW